MDGGRGHHATGLSLRTTLRDQLSGHSFALLGVRGKIARRERTNIPGALTACRRPGLGPAARDREFMGSGAES
jgi:hypothetical protein